MSPDRDETFLTVAEVADWLKLNQQTVRNWIEQGSLPAVRVGRRVRIKRSDLERVLDQGYRGGSGAVAPRPTGPSADDFWGGEQVGVAEPDPEAPAVPSPTIRGERPEHEHGPGGNGSSQSAGAGEEAL